MHALLYRFDPTEPFDVPTTTRALQSLIDDAYHAGGGRVVLPAGTHTSGPIVLKDRVELHLNAGATLRFSDRREDYPLIETDWEGEPAVRCAPPIRATGASDVSITGHGTIDGAGEIWRPVKRFKVSDDHWSRLVAQTGSVNDGAIWWPTQGALDGAGVVARLRRERAAIDAYDAVRDFLRPNLLQFTDCRRVRLGGVTFTNSPAWCLHLLCCTGVTISDVNVVNPSFAQNGDALDIESCRDVTVTHSTFDAGDDAICIKSGRDQAGRDRGRPSENITVSNCTVVHGHGGVVVGSEMSGGVRNVSVTNCTFAGTDVGLRFKSTRGRGGTVENVDVCNVTMRDIVREAISVNCYYGIAADAPARPFDETTPTFRGLRFRNITCDGAARAIELRGLPERPISDVSLDTVRIRATRGAELVDVDGVSLRGVRLTVAEGPGLTTSRTTRLRLEEVDA